MISTLRHGWIITERDLLHWVRQPAGPIFGLMFSIMLLLMFALLFGGAMEVPGGGSYLGFLLPGIIALTMMFGIETTMTAMGQDARKGITDRFRSMPIGSGAVALGRACADMVNSAVQVATLLVVGLLIGWRTGSGLGSVVLAVALLLWLRFAVLWIGIFLGLVLPGEGTTTAVQVLVWPVGFLSNVFVAPETMPGWLAPFADWNPVSATATAVRDLFGSPTGVTDGVLLTHPVLLATLWPAVLVAVFLPLSARAYRRLRR